MLRKIGEKYEIDSAGSLVKSATGEMIPHNEPVFLLRAKDKTAVSTLTAYASLCEESGSSPDQVAAVHRAIAAFMDWQAGNATKVSGV